MLNPKGAISRGISIEASPPISQPGPLFELNQEPKTDNFNNSAPLKTFLSIKENLAEVPIFLILECVNSVSKPVVNFSMGVKNKSIFNSSPERLIGVNEIFVVLKFLSDLRWFLVKFLSESLKTSPGLKKIDAAKYLGLYFNLSCDKKLMPLYTKEYWKASSFFVYE